jgi:hypothetical protein
MEILDAVGQQRMAVAGSGAMTYNSFSNLYSVIDSADSTQTYNLAASNVQSVFHNFLPVSQANNYGFDAFKTDVPLNTDGTGTNYDSDIVLKKVSFSRGGVKLGIDYDIDVEKMSSEKRPETGIMVHALDAVKKYSSIQSTLSQPLLLGYSRGDEIIYRTSGSQQGTTVDSGKRNFAVGLAMDRFSGVGVNFRDQAYSSRIQSTLDGKSPNSVYTYVLARNTLAYSPSGIMVSS